MQKEINKNMTTKQAFIYSAEKAGTKAQYYLDTHERKYLDEAIMYIKAAYILSKEIVEGNEV